jgi:hypothetical protein
MRRDFLLAKKTQNAIDRICHDVSNAVSGLEERVKNSP